MSRRRGSDEDYHDITRRPALSLSNQKPGTIIKHCPVEGHGDYQARAMNQHCPICKEIVRLKKVNDKIDRLLHDAERARGGAVFAAQMGHVEPAAALQAKYRRLRASASVMFLANPGSTWPECEWPAPTRTTPPPATPAP